jgi:outer membrane protein OmpA-like peptidoglycan-associated protein
VLITGKLVREDQLSNSLSVVDSLNEPAQLKQNVLTNKVVSVEMLSDSAASVFLQEVKTNEQGEFEFWVDPGRDYKINVEDSTLLDHSFLVSTQKVQGDETIELSTVALPEIPDKSIVLENIYYRFDQTELTSEAKETLENTILKLMNQYPLITIEISAHTDSLGDALYNQKLSEGRAGSVVDYLVSKGVSSNRLSAKGYGASHPVAPNTNTDGTDNPDGRRRNRRTEFRITGTIKTNMIGIN